MHRAFEIACYYYVAYSLPPLLSSMELTGFANVTIDTF
nr:MAG TPA: hypothetical protein [Caudoviricetes sp.]